MRHKIIYSISLIFYFSIAQIDYNNQIQPIFDNNCVSCHSNGAAYTGGIELTSYDELMAGGYTTNETNVLSILESYVTTGYMPPTWGGA
jgi:mono/diheme cytochrome c family protein